MTRLTLCLGAGAVVLAGCQGASDSRTAGGADAADTAATSSAVRTAAESITADDLLAHIKDLAADSMEGRGPGTPGEEKTVAYLTAQFKRLGLAPGNPDGSYIQNVALVGYTSHPSASIAAGGKTIAMKFPDDYVAVSRHNRKETKVAGSDIVFVGYGVVAPEYGWDDYKGMDVKGKTLLMLVNDPPVASPNDSTQLDTAMFKGRAMTYYGRWTYKYEIATDKGAAAAIIVHETGPAGYPFDVVQGSWGRENFDVKSPDSERRVGVEAWITSDKAKELLGAAGLSFDSLKAAARRKDFRPVVLRAKASFDVKIDAREVQSKNVIAKLEGSDPAKKGEYLIYTAHWDHLGRDTTAKGDQIFNGAIDNASGVAQMLGLATAFTKLATPPQRSVLFIAVTAEEKGLLGAKGYATQPLYPIDKTLADINVDEANVWGPTKDITVIGLGNSTLDGVLARVASTGGRTLRADPEPEKGSFYRSDHFEFAKQGVPALFIGPGVEPVSGPATGPTPKAKFDETDYHKPSDDVKADWNLAGAVEDAKLLFRVGYLVANGETFPEWKPGTEFKAKRDSMMKK
jgi:Zn-dependent M28 family amino/carboxypeptidase